MFPINWEFLPNSSFTNDQGQLDPELNEAGRQQAVVVMFCFSNRYAERDEYFFYGKTWWIFSINPTILALTLIFLAKILVTKVAGRLLSEARPAAVYSSDLRRASVTAEIIAGACGVSNVSALFCCCFFQERIECIRYIHLYSPAPSLLFWFSLSKKGVLSRSVSSYGNPKIYQNTHPSLSPNSHMVVISTQ